jgi:hypothetical protein
MPNTRITRGPNGDEVVPDFDSDPPAVPPSAGAAIPALVDGAHGMDSAANFEKLYDCVQVMRAELIARGFLTGP